MRSNILLAISGHDPSGGAGIAADIQVATQFGYGIYPLITSLTVQNYSSFTAKKIVSATLLKSQWHALQEEPAPRAIKVGLLLHASQVAFVRQLASRGNSQEIPIVVDPILVRGADGKKITSVLYHSLCLPQVVLTPNRIELQLLGGAANLIHLGARAIVETNEAEITIHTQRKKRVLTVEHLEGSYHGSGCTFSTALACLLGKRRSLYTAVQEAARYTHRTLQRSIAMSSMRMPFRMG